VIDHELVDRTEAEICGETECPVNCYRCPGVEAPVLKDGS
jgi:hypothetical protein